MKFLPADVAAEIRRQAPNLVGVPDPLDPAKLLWAISGNESSFGEDSVPRHEPAYDVGGRYSKNPRQAELLRDFGSAGACSYGPLQVMLVNCPLGSSPSDFDSLAKGIAAGVYALNKLLAEFKPKNISEIASCYNAGHIQHPLSPAVQKYADDLNANYLKPMV